MGKPKGNHTNRTGIVPPSERKSPNGNNRSAPSRNQFAAQEENDRPKGGPVAGPSACHQYLRNTTGSGGAGGVEPHHLGLHRAACYRYTTCRVATARRPSVILGGIEPPISSVSGRRLEPLGHRIFVSAKCWVLSSEKVRSFPRLLSTQNSALNKAEGKGFEPSCLSATELATRHGHPYPSPAPCRIGCGATAAGRGTNPSRPDVVRNTRPATAAPHPMTVDPPGVEPGLPACHTGVIPPRPQAPLREFQVPRSRFQVEGAKQLSLRSTWNLERGTWNSRSGIAGSRTPTPCLQGTARARARPRFRSVTGVGVEPTHHRLSTRGLYQLAYPVSRRPRRGRKSRAWDSNPANQAYEARPSTCPPAVETFELRTRELNPTSRLMRPGRAPARPQYKPVVTVGFEPTLSTF